MDNERLQVLKMVETGQITAQEAATLLSALEAPTSEPEQNTQPVATDSMSVGNPWSGFWRFPFLAGGIILFLGLAVLGLLSLSDAAAGWLVCGWMPIVLGALIVLVAWWSRGARWLHLRISERGERRIAISFPLPLTLAAWVLKIVHPFVPQLKDTGVDDLIIALRDGTLPDGPLSIDVQDEEEGEHVQVYIG